MGGFPEPSRSRVVEGVGLHTGSRARVTLLSRPGPVRLSVGGVDGRIGDLSIVGTERATTVQLGHGGARVATVEHLFAALGGLSIHEGVTVCVEGAELPLLDGGAAAWCDHLRSLGLRPSGPRLRVARGGAVHVSESRYEFAVGEGFDVQVRFETADARVAPEARWLGDPADFRSRIAPARTFAFLADVERLTAAGLARGADPAAVVVILPDTIHCVAPYSSDEPARHKLLDLVGDSYLFGGPPRGRMRVLRPGHTANAHALRRALAGGILASDERSG